VGGGHVENADLTAGGGAVQRGISELELRIRQAHFAESRSQPEEAIGLIHEGGEKIFVSQLASRKKPCWTIARARRNDGS